MTEEQKQYDITPSTAAVVPTIAIENGLLAPNDFAGLWYMCQLVVKSGMAPKDKQSPEKCLIASQFGGQLGLNFLASIQNVAVINGMPSIWGDSMLALVEGSGTVEEFYEFSDGDLAQKNYRALCIAKKKGRGNALNVPELIKQGFTSAVVNEFRANLYYVHTFDYGDAERAGKLPADPKGVWSHYPKRMFQMRARSFVLRDGWPGVLKGIWSREEALDANVADLAPQENGAFHVETEETKLSDKLKDASGPDVEFADNGKIDGSISDIDRDLGKTDDPKPTITPENFPDADVVDPEIDPLRNTSVYKNFNPINEAVGKRYHAAKMLRLTDSLDQMNVNYTASWPGAKLHQLVIDSSFPDDDTNETEPGPDPNSEWETVIEGSLVDELAVDDPPPDDESDALSSISANKKLREDFPLEWDLARQNLGFGMLPASEDGARVWNQKISELLDLDAGQS